METCRNLQAGTFFCHLGHEEPTVEAFLVHLGKCLPKPGRPSRAGGTLNMAT